MGRDRRLFGFGLLTVLGLYAVLIWPAFYGGVQTMHDMGDWYVPMRAFYARCLERGDASEWIPNVYCGYYLHGDGQVGQWHPWHLVIYRFLPFSLAVNLEMTTSFLVSCLGVFFLLRRWGLERVPALFGGCAVAFSGYHLQHVEHMNAIQVLAHVPWTTLLVDVALRSPNGRRSGLACLGVAVLTTSELLIGYPQYFWFSNLWEGVYALLLIAQKSTRPSLGRILGLASAKVVGVLGGAVQLLPTADVLSTSLREAMSRDERAQWAWHPFEWSTLVAPYLFRAKSLATFHPGVVTTVLVAWLVLRRGVRWFWRDVPTRLAASVGVLAAWLALGRLGFLYELHLDAPLVGVFRMPYRYLSLTALALGLLSAFALRELWRDGDAARRAESEAARRPLLYALPVLGLVVVAAIAWLHGSGRSFYVTRHFGSVALALCGVAGLGLAAWTVHRMESGRGMRSGTVLLFALMLVDLGGYGAQWLYRGGVPVTLDTYRAAIPEPPSRTPGMRVSAALQNQLVFEELSMPHGYMPMVPDAPLLTEIDEHGARDERLLRVAGVQWIQDEETGNRWTQVSGHVDLLRAQRREWIEVPDPMPRARLVAETRVVENDARTAVEASKDVDIANVAVVERELPSVVPDGRGQGRVRVVADRPGRIEVEVDVEAPRLLVVNERMRPGWIADVDGRAVEPVRTYGTFLGCVVGPGSNRVTFRFEPRSLRRGRWISLGAWAAMLVAALFLRRARVAPQKFGPVEVRTR